MTTINAEKRNAQWNTKALRREGEKLTLIFDGQSIPVLLKEKTVSLLNDSIGQISFLAVAE